MAIPRCGSCKEPDFGQARPGKGLGLVWGIAAFTSQSCSLCLRRVLLTGNLLGIYWESQFHPTPGLKALRDPSQALLEP